MPVPQRRPSLRALPSRAMGAHLPAPPRGRSDTDGASAGYVEQVDWPRPRKRINDA